MGLRHRTGRIPCLAAPKFRWSSIASAGRSAPNGGLAQTLWSLRERNGSIRARTGLIPARSYIANFSVLSRLMSGDKQNPSGDDTRNPATLRSRERQFDGSIGHISAWQGWAETGDEDAGRGGGDAAASRFGLGHPVDRGGDWMQSGDGSAVFGGGCLGAVRGSDPAQPAVGSCSRLLNSWRRAHSRRRPGSRCLRPPRCVLDTTRLPRHPLLPRPCALD